MRVAEQQVGHHDVVPTVQLAVRNAVVKIQIELALIDSAAGELDGVGRQAGHPQVAEFHRYVSQVDRVQHVHFTLDSGQAIVVHLALQRDGSGFGTLGIDRGNGSPEFVDVCRERQRQGPVGKVHRTVANSDAAHQDRNGSRPLFRAGLRGCGGGFPGCREARQVRGQVLVDDQSAEWFFKLEQAQIHAAAPRVRFEAIDGEAFPADQGLVGQGVLDTQVGDGEATRRGEGFAGLEHQLDRGVQQAAANEDIEPLLRVGLAQGKRDSGGLRHALDRDFRQHADRALETQAAPGSQIRRQADRELGMRVGADVPDGKFDVFRGDGGLRIDAAVRVPDPAAGNDKFVDTEVPRGRPIGAWRGGLVVFRGLRKQVQKVYPAFLVQPDLEVRFGPADGGKRQLVFRVAQPAPGKLQRRERDELGRWTQPGGVDVGEVRPKAFELDIQTAVRQFTDPVIGVHRQHSPQVLQGQHGFQVGDQVAEMRIFQGEGAFRTQRPEFDAALPARYCALRQQEAHCLSAGAVRQCVQFLDRSRQRPKREVDRIDRNIVTKIDHALVDTQVMDQQPGQPRRVRRSLLPGLPTGFHLCQQPGQAAVRRRKALEQQRQPVEADFPERPGPPEQARKLEIGIELVEADEPGAVGVFECEVIDLQVEDVGIETDLADGGVPAHIVPRRSDQQVRDQRRHREKTGEGVDEDQPCGPEAFATRAEPPGDISQARQRRGRIRIVGICRHGSTRRVECRFSADYHR